MSRANVNITEIDLTIHFPLSGLCILTSACLSACLSAYLSQNANSYRKLLKWVQGSDEGITLEGLVDMDETANVK